MIAAPESFTTARLRLRRPQLADVSAVFAYGSDIEVARYMDWPKSVTPQDTVRATERAIQRWESGDEFSWRLTVPPDDTPVGGVASLRSAGCFVFRPPATLTTRRRLVS
jgi:RimJ/RimL family protein N-acetyltransferase